MVNKVIGQNLNVSLGLKSSARLNKPDNTNFMAELKKQFDVVTSNMKHIPGMPGIYSANPQTLASLNISNISDKAPLI